ncbi:MAG: response regulator transcription factor [Planctomycetota bacterium]|jgi:DNA-binding response OmpR family regulator
MRLLVVEDDLDLAEILRQGLTEEGYAVDLSLDGEDGLWRATTVDYDVAILDILLPKVDGFEILEGMRRAGRTAPVLFLTARDATEDRVHGLDSGGDDYLVKPFAWDELLARIRALLRRGSKGTDGLIRYRDIELDPARREVRRGGERVELTAKEFQILHVLIEEPERVITRTEIIERVYDDDYDGMSNVIDVLVSRMRKKLTRNGEPPILRTVRGVGYALGGGDDA